MVRGMTDETHHPDPVPPTSDTMLRRDGLTKAADRLVELLGPH
jgi:hypothetical protein